MLFEKRRRVDVDRGRRRVREEVWITESESEADEVFDQIGMGKGSGVKAADGGGGKNRAAGRREVGSINGAINSKIEYRVPWVEGEPARVIILGRTCLSVKGKERRGIGYKRPWLDPELRLRTRAERR